MAARTRAPIATAGRRLSADARRTQLLDVAVEILAESGSPVVTMEGVAARAGVSKALGYRYFDNADELLAAVAEREVVALTHRVQAALEHTTTFEEAVRASLTTFLDALAEQGTVIVTVTQARIPDGPARSRERAADFYGSLAAEHYGLTSSTATVAASILLSGLEGLIDCWLNRRMRRRELVDIYTTMCVGAVEALASRPPVIGEG